MPAPKKHPPYKGSETGGPHGYLGKPKDAYTEEDLHKLGKEFIKYMKKPRSIWFYGFCEVKDFNNDHLDYLRQKYPVFARYYAKAKEIQERKLIEHPFWREADGNHARFVLERTHEKFKAQIGSNDGVEFTVTHAKNPSPDQSETASSNGKCE